MAYLNPAGKSQYLAAAAAEVAFFDFSEIGDNIWRKIPANSDIFYVIILAVGA